MVDDFGLTQASADLRFVPSGPTGGKFFVYPPTLDFGTVRLWPKSP